MNFNEALELAKKGEKIRLKTWRNSEFYFYVKNNILYNSNHDVENYKSATGKASNDWVIYKTPKLHTFEVALKALKNGIAIRRKDNHIIDSKGYFNLDIDDVMANDWIIEGEDGE